MKFSIYRLYCLTLYQIKAQPFIQLLPWTHCLGNRLCTEDFSDKYFIRRTCLAPGCVAPQVCLCCTWGSMKDWLDSDIDLGPAKWPGSNASSFTIAAEVMGFISFAGMLWVSQLSLCFFTGCIDVTQSWLWQKQPSHQVYGKNFVAYFHLSLFSPS